jgi:hypothetical protein
VKQARRPARAEDDGLAYSSSASPADPASVLQQGRPSPDPEESYHQRRIDKHMRCEGVIAENVKPRVACPQREHAPEHSRPKVLEHYSSTIRSA